MRLLDDFDEIQFELTTDKSLPMYSHSIMNAIATCPTYGMVTYVANRVFSNASRAMPLEAGAAAHETFAAARVWQLLQQGLMDHADVHGERLFSEDRYESMRSAATDAGSDKRNAMLRFCLEAFYTSGFYDDPADNRRTFTNIEEALIAYLDRFNFDRNVWVADKSNPLAPVGIEVPLDVTVSFDDALRVRLIGTADGLHWRGDELVLDENKTASRLNEAWIESFQTSHQITGYLLMLSTTLGVHVRRAAVHGMAIPLPRSYDVGGLVTEHVSRNDTQIRDYLEWVLNIVQTVELYKSNPLAAPKHTGACNKYFRPCSLIPLCASPSEERAEMFVDMVERTPSPSERAMEGED